MQRARAIHTSGPPTHWLAYLRHIGGGDDAEDIICGSPFARNVSNMVTQVVDGFRSMEPAPMCGLSACMPAWLKVSACACFAFAPSASEQSAPKGLREAAAANDSHTLQYLPKKGINILKYVWRHKLIFYYVSKSHFFWRACQGGTIILVNEWVVPSRVSEDKPGGGVCVRVRLPAALLAASWRWRHAAPPILVSQIERTPGTQAPQIASNKTRPNRSLDLICMTFCKGFKIFRRSLWKWLRGQPELTVFSKECKLFWGATAMYREPGKGL